MNCGQCIPDGGGRGCKGHPAGADLGVCGAPGGAAGGGDGDSSGSRFFHKEPRL